MNARLGIKTTRFRAYRMDQVTSWFDPIPWEKIDEWFLGLSRNERDKLVAQPREADFLIGNQLAFL